ncbi:dipeptidase [Shewanella sp. JNE10-2]|uniref:membrane dipeptidase n=1 Tax=unclassified Shewanella TaxID=196818 RepID=UPI00005FB172|nr:MULTISPECIES: membrane dipeptidase [unclassified Shewanella]ABM26149.1 peptidase M19, renal dipeptidase [Shewanella sp. W3-18-1]MCK7630349.1 dipeptidase [Shewanella sp. JNE9-1]MCK7633526.1 dipeptidase [Shewanella sp. JNE17]MCK7645516.1 dipeptidase [Shewanella sp. JNE3-1]MCK7648715.1 dipeptidase [Shewanella sp. JNE8]
MPNQAVNHYRRTLLKGLGAATLLSPLASIPSFAAAPRRLYVDGLSFLPDDLADVTASKLDAYLCDISAIETLQLPDGTQNYKRTYKACMESIKLAAKRVSDHPDILLQGLTGRDIQLARESKRTAVYFQIQGADCVEEDSDVNQWARLDEFHQQGLRILQLTHHYGNTFAGGALDNDANGGLNKPLTAHGRELIAKLNHSNILVDLSHASAQTALDVAKISKSPVVQSHGAARGIVNHARCSPDEVIRAIANSGGVFGVFMMSFWLTPNPVPTINDYIRQLEYVMRVGGVDCVAIANDFPLRGQENLLALGNDNAQGIKEYQEWWYSLRAKNVLGFDAEPRHVVIPELNHIDRMERIDDALAKARFKSTDRDRFMGGNWQRVLNQVLI